MNRSQVDMLDFVPQEELVCFFRCKKTEMSHGINEPLLFLNQLRDNNLVPEDLYQNVIKMKSKERKQIGVYKILEWLEKERGQYIKLFWRCVFQEHILQRYPVLRSLQTSLLEGSFRVNEMLPIAEKLTGNEQKQGVKKRKMSYIYPEEEDAGPSYVSSSSQKMAKPYLVEESNDDLEEFSEKEDRRQEEEEEAEEESELVDMSAFEAAVLPVICGSFIGVLYKHRFAGSRSKSIRTEERWFSPEEFVKQNLALTGGHWKNKILCYDKTLDYLVKMKILDIHPMGCRCQLCCPKDPLQQDKDDLCFICNGEGNVVCCVKCPRAFHHKCHSPKLQARTLGSNWNCTFCLIKNCAEALWTPMSRVDALRSPVSEWFINMRCEYLLMHLYKADKQHVFTDNPSKNDERYRSVISKPMWLNKVKAKLQKNIYKTVREFVNDINLIFNNCQTFHKDNTFGRMGAVMKKIFQKEFDTIFKIQ